ncbi:hypothetical protein K402DRAFT_394635 [Aulographum hederae CBS 113979]|uniref:SWI/SNF family DNA-dependent ATPase Ris1 n=1 Tax=Aulographum hederae CBS 113979 TaxID=1176131 RepID=A0A6G1GXW4_9PEZI|nr:hypothetical protein K402DRAFT_394635 [Aulographum hederae CBS 113979]
MANPLSSTQSREDLVFDIDTLKTRMETLDESTPNYRDEKGRLLQELLQLQKRLRNADAAPRSRDRDNDDSSAIPGAFQNEVDDIVDLEDPYWDLDLIYLGTADEMQQQQRQEREENAAKRVCVNDWRRMGNDSGQSYLQNVISSVANMFNQGPSSQSRPSGGYAQARHDDRGRGRSSTPGRNDRGRSSTPGPYTRNDRAPTGSRGPFLSSTASKPGSLRANYQSSVTSRFEPSQNASQFTFNAPVSVGSSVSDTNIPSGQRSSNSLGEPSTRNERSLKAKNEDSYEPIDPHDHAQYVERLVKDMSSHDDSNQPREPTPKQMCLPLHPHQQIGVAWLKRKENGASRGSILADDMGLGKTVQAIALILSNPWTVDDYPFPKTTLIVAPVSLMKQWSSELQAKIKLEHRLKVHIHHGNSKKTYAELKQYHIVLTTYQTIAQEYSRRERQRTNDGDDDDDDADNSNLNEDDFAIIGSECRWLRVVLDEAHHIKNNRTASAKAIKLVQAKYRLCMTGTPMMNSVQELHSLVQFLRIQPHSDPARFKLDFLEPLRQLPENPYAMRNLHTFLKTILLRRLKSSLIDGQPILKDLPPRTSHIEEVTFDEHERELYTALERKTQVKFNKFVKGNAVMKNYMHILVLLLRLRQACCHHSLIMDLSVSAATGISEEEMARHVRELPESVVVRIKRDVRAGTGAFSCPICYDAVENPAIFVPCGHDICAECYAKVMAPETPTCPECRNQLTDRVIDFETFKKVHWQDMEVDGGALESAILIDDDSDDDGFVVGDEDNDEADELNVKDEEAQEKGQKGSTKSKGAKKLRSLAALRKDGLRNKESKEKYLTQLSKDWKSSTKISKTMELLQKFERNDPTEKTIVFSLFTSLLDLLEVPMSAAGMSYSRYDGSMPRAARDRAVDTFNSTSTTHPRVLLMSLKAGSVGLNLARANHVIVFDPYWNPYTEEQAIDRVHRLGQTRPVSVHRLLVGRTVEDRIWELQERKRAVVESALDERKIGEVSRLGVRDLEYLFGVRR